MLAVPRETGFRLIEELEVVETSAVVLSRASQPLSTTIGTLDAIAMLWRERGAMGLDLTTHDVALGIAGRACGFRVFGT